MGIKKRRGDASDVGAAIEEINPATSSSFKYFFFPTNSPPRVQLLTALAYYLALNIICSVIYGTLNGINPENAFHANVFGVLGLLLLTIGFILQLNDAGTKKLFRYSPERKGYIEYIVTGICVLVGAFTFLG